MKKKLRELYGYEYLYFYLFNLYTNFIYKLVVRAVISPTMRHQGPASAFLRRETVQNIKPFHKSSAREQDLLTANPQQQA